MTFTWESGRNLVKVVKGSVTTTYKYSDGLRLRKTVGGVTHSYIYDGDLVLSEYYSGTTLIFVYDEIGLSVGFKHNGSYYLYEKNIMGDIVGIYNTSGTKVATYVYDAWGNVLSSSGSMANINPLRYRGYYYDSETGFYYLYSRYYDPVIGRFINGDDISYLGESDDLKGYNLYSYCGNNPVMYVDPSGHFWDTVLDIVFLFWDVYDLCTDGGYKDWKNWAALGVDVIFSVIPFVTGGGGKVIKLANVADDVSDLSKVTVIGETMTRVTDIAKMYNAADNLYSGLKSYKKLSSLKYGGKVIAEICGKASNAAWLYGKLRSGYKIIDAGIDVTRAVRSSSYMLERTVVCIWRYRNAWKWAYHLNGE